LIYKVGILGTGKVGKEIAALLSDGFVLGDDRFELSDAISESGSLQSIEGIPVRQWGEPEREPVHLWIDFSRPEGTLRLLEQVSTPILIGTTGFTPEQLSYVQAYAKRFPVLLAPNTSPGMKAVLRMTSESAGLGSLGFTTVLEEDHHRFKVDAPSGSAKRLLGLLKEIGFQNTQVHSTRAGSLVGTHTVRWIGEGEEILLQHRVTDRNVFAKGALWGARFLVKQTKAKLYTFEEVNT
jgi:4-hydroxy-tetrahydrodipicolinate reductase